ncbi:hypothetical protein DFJ73DRAFT_53868 [Zopfochytrium polystomum]|nr:hypothetical protein DFJ73DRAFT_53868 [Zopfochytrium polystomum]
MSFVTPPPYRIGNWCEETFLQGARLSEFLQKARSGSLEIQKTELRLGAAQQDVDLSDSVRFGAPLMLKNLGTGCHLAVDVPNTYPEQILETDTFPLTTTARYVPPTARTVFSLVPVDPFDEIPRYGQKLGVVASAALVDRPMFLGSEFKSFASFASKSKEQQAYLSFRQDNRSSWRIVFTDPHMQPEMEGQPVEADTPFLLQHCLTGSFLSSESSSKTMIRNDFGVEWEVDCHTRKLAPLCNRWMIQVGHAKRAVQK